MQDTPAILRFLQARRDMLDALHAWLETAPDADDLAEEFTATVAAMRQLITLASPHAAVRGAPPHKGGNRE